MEIPEKLNEDLIRLWMHDDVVQHVFDVLKHRGIYQFPDDITGKLPKWRVGVVLTVLSELGYIKKTDKDRYSSVGDAVTVLANADNEDITKFLKEVSFPHEILVLSSLSHRGYAKVSDVTNDIGYKDTKSVYRLLIKLVYKGLVIQTGVSRRLTYYRLSDYGGLIVTL
ncbi:hypothetical protein LLE49_19845 [Alicyclobacillus tolerans]|uniref:hypothetical protein n=1 Tax=Alicyclobacillus tolerans TaxID=90970 RepID=UPI001F3A3E7F|nr:hypothetical protein [Alicyclobacillus tolerans]MCF8566977.1 hypothetical protein [Alicyclobacillus tolerans]